MVLETFNFPSLELEDEEDDVNVNNPTTTTTTTTNPEDSTKEQPPIIDYGYEEVIPDNEAAMKEAVPIPTTFTTHKTHTYNASATPRRSSLKSNSPESVERRTSLSGSIGSGGGGGGSYYRVRIRGEEKPVQRRRSIEFNKTTEIAHIIPQLHYLSNSKSSPELSSLTVSSALTSTAEEEQEQHGSPQQQQQQQQGEEEDIESILWYTGNEIHQMKHERNKLVRKMRKNQLAMNDDEVRGLERYYNKNEIKYIKTQAWLSVFKEQDTQESKGQFDEDRLSKVYNETTSVNTELATKFAMESHKDVDDYIQTPRTKKLMLTIQQLQQRQQGSQPATMAAAHAHRRSSC